ncbi:MAG TPA: class A beta-lactamase-related serine hydrolase [Bryobacterales bacterium]|nr:class A beta-lactamase-related serine hydrolase [Bryobacterales bacterium]
MKRNRCRLLLIALVVSISAAAQVLPRVEPEKVGLSSERLARIDSLVEQHISQGDLAGAVTLIARHGKIVHLGVYGMADREAGRPMKEDTIFRIASMTKPITSVAVMMLYEEGRFLLSDPISKYLPEFAHMTVLPPGAPRGSTPIPAKRPITIRHLLTHTAGFTYHWNPRIGPLYNAYGIPHGLGPTPYTLAEAMKLLAKIPLVNHPGEQWEYGLSIDVLGRLVEVTSGMSLDEFFRQRIFEPLGMKDTYFYLPEEKVARLAAVYGKNEDGKLVRVKDENVRAGEASGSTDYPYAGPKKYFSGGGGLCSTALDYARFAQMILNKGRLGRARLLGPKTVELMTMDHLGHIVKDPPLAFGLGFAIDTTERGFTELTSEGTHGWGGFWYTEFFISPETDMIGVFMAQVYPSNGLTVKQKLKVLAHQAIIEE